jgi:hypothetical protein
LCFLGQANFAINIDYAHSRDPLCTINSARRSHIVGRCGDLPVSLHLLTFLFNLSLHTSFAATLHANISLHTSFAATLHANLTLHTSFAANLYAAVTLSGGAADLPVFLANDDADDGSGSGGNYGLHRFLLRREHILMFDVKHQSYKRRSAFLFNDSLTIASDVGALLGGGLKHKRTVRFPPYRKSMTTTTTTTTPTTTAATMATTSVEAKTATPDAAVVAAATAAAAAASAAAVDVASVRVERICAAEQPITNAATVTATTTAVDTATAAPVDTSTAPAEATFTTMTDATTAAAAAAASTSTTIADATTAVALTRSLHADTTLLWFRLHVGDEVLTSRCCTCSCCCFFFY